MRRFPSRALLAISCLLVSLSLSSGISSSNDVTLEFMQIFTTHDWLPLKPTVYFRCQGENKTILPDVKETNVPYNFSGVESWQPLTEFPNQKCKRCGFYEGDSTNDDKYDEWELCPHEFVNGTYLRFKAKEFNATFRCPACSSFKSALGETSPPKEETPHKRLSTVLLLFISTLATIVVCLGLVAGYMCWKKWKKERDQKRFIQLFDEAEEETDIELNMENGI